MSSSNHRLIIIIKTSLVVFSFLLQTAFGGICWSKMTKKGHCKEILQYGVSQEQCCNFDGANIAYSATNLTDADVFFWRTLSDGVPCQACKATCDGVKCAANKKCVIKTGRPRCVCAPKCNHRKNTEKGGPVCGTDGRTYKSLCRLKKRVCRTKNKSLNVNYFGFCQSSCERVKCSFGKYCVQDQNLNAHCIKCNLDCLHRSVSSLRRVCGIDGLTYRSTCHLKEASCMKGHAITVAYQGECKRNASCTNVRCRRGQSCLLHKPSNLPRCVSCSECPESKSVTTIQKEMGGPLCGTNNQTYDSWCYMVEDSCKKGYVVETQSYGSCKTSGS